MKNKVSFNEEKQAERVISQSLLISIIGTIMCVVFLCSATYSWFTAAEKSGENVIESSLFALDFDVRDENGMTVPVADNIDGTHTCTFENAGTYKITLKMNKDTTASKGYCQLTISSKAEKMQTAPISNDASVGGVNPFTFTIVVEENTVIIFESKWGMSASPDIYHDSTYVFAEEPENP